MSVFFGDWCLLSFELFCSGSHVRVSPSCSVLSLYTLVYGNNLKIEQWECLWKTKTWYPGHGPLAFSPAAACEGHASFEFCCSEAPRWTSKWSTWLFFFFFSLHLKMWGLGFYFFSFALLTWICFSNNLSLTILWSLGSHLLQKISHMVKLLWIFLIQESWNSDIMG